MFSIDQYCNNTEITTGAESLISKYTVENDIVAAREPSRVSVRWANMRTIFKIYCRELIHTTLVLTHFKKVLKLKIEITTRFVLS